MKVKCKDALIDLVNMEHIVVITATQENVGLFGSKIEKKQFEKIESVLNKNYVKLPFGIRILF